MDSTLKRRGNGRFYVVSTWNPRGVFLGKEQSKHSIDLKPAAGEVVTSALEYFKEKKHGKVPVDADSIFRHVVNSLRIMKDVHTKEYAKFKTQEILFQCSFGAQLQKEHTTPVSHLPNSRPVTPLGSPYSAGTASIHQIPVLTQNQQFQMDARNMRLNSNTPNILSSQSSMYNCDWCFSWKIN